MVANSSLCISWGILIQHASEIKFHEKILASVAKNFKAFKFGISSADKHWKEPLLLIRIQNSLTIGKFMNELNRLQSVSFSALRIFDVNVVSSCSYLSFIDESEVPAMCIYFALAVPFNQVVSASSCSLMPLAQISDGFWTPCTCLH